MFSGVLDPLPASRSRLPARFTRSVLAGAAPRHERVEFFNTIGPRSSHCTAGVLELGRGVAHAVTLPVTRFQSSIQGFFSHISRTRERQCSALAQASLAFALLQLSSQERSSVFSSSSPLEYLLVFPINFILGLLWPRGLADRGGRAERRSTPCGTGDTA